MKVFIAGATGVLGRRLTRDLAFRDHTVVGLSRNDGNDGTITSLGGVPRRADLFDVDSLARAAEGCEVIIHAATRIPPKARTHTWDWAENDRIRRAGTRALSEAAGRVHARIYLQQSVVWVAEPSDESAFDEDSPLAPGLITATASEGEGLARDAGSRFGFAVAILRCGGFYSADSVQTRLMATKAMRRRLPVIGSGTAVWSNLHADDASTAFVAAAEAGRSGLWHVVDDAPAPVGDFIRELARDIGAPEPGHVPTWLARLYLGPTTLSLFTRSTRTKNERIKKELGWRPRYPGYQTGLRQVADEWKAEGFPTASGRGLRSPSEVPGRP